MRGRAMRRAGAVLAAMVAGAWVALELAVRAVALPAGIGDAPPRTPVLLARISHKLRCETPREAGWDKAGAESGEGCMSAYCPNRDSSPTPSQPASRKSQQMACERCGLDRNGEEIAVVGNDLARACFPVGLDAMGPWLPAATIAIEDRRFRWHRGVDPVALASAVLRNARAGRVVSGASTITQQLVKRGSEPTRRGLHAKVLEALAAIRLEGAFGKDRILETYLNGLDYGNRRIGPEAASRAFFGKSAANLTPAEAVYLAGLPQAPTRFNPWKNPAAAARRYAQNVRLLARSGSLPAGLSEEQMLAAMPRPQTNHPPSHARHFVNAVAAGDWHRVAGDGVALRTTLDLPLQKSVELLLDHHLRSAGRRGVGDAAVVVVENRSGEVRAMASGGGHRFLDACGIARSCGSTLKPFLYADAIDRRALTAASLLPDTPDAIPATYPGFDPKNYSRRYFGPVRMREALANSLNVPAVAVVARLGARNAFERMRRWGFAFPGGFDAAGAGFVLGNVRVTPLELAAAYAALARGGAAWPAKFVPSDRHDVVQAASPEACAIVTDILCDNRARSRSFGPSSPLALPWRCAAKTGTSSGFRDGWCAGFSRDHTVVVWAGGLDGRPMEEVLAVRSSAPLWAGVMGILRAHGDRPVPGPEATESLVPALVDGQTGLLPRPGGPTIREWFLEGTVPTQSASTWFDGETLVLPEEYAAWCAGPHNHLGARTRRQEPAILFPTDGAVFSASPAISINRQVIHARANTANVRWSLNGDPLPSGTIPLVPGRHTLEAASVDGAASVVFVVEQD
jgi:penicillin-binding protein 1C